MEYWRTISIREFSFSFAKNNWLMYRRIIFLIDVRNIQTRKGHGIKWRKRTVAIFHQIYPLDKWFVTWIVSDQVTYDLRVRFYTCWYNHLRQNWRTRLDTWHAVWSRNISVYWNIWLNRSTSLTWKDKVEEVESLFLLGQMVQRLRYNGISIVMLIEVYVGHWHRQFFHRQLIALISSVDKWHNVADVKYSRRTVENVFSFEKNIHYTTKCCSSMKWEINRFLLRLEVFLSSEIKSENLLQLTKNSDLSFFII